MGRALKCEFPELGYAGVTAATLEPTDVFCSSFIHITFGEYMLLQHRPILQQSENFWAL